MLSWLPSNTSQDYPTIYTAILLLLGGNPFYKFSILNNLTMDGQRRKYKRKDGALIFYLKCYV